MFVFLALIVVAQRVFVFSQPIKNFDDALLHNKGFEARINFAHLNKEVLCELVITICEGKISKSVLREKGIFFDFLFALGLRPVHPLRLVVHFGLEFGVTGRLVPNTLPLVDQ